MDNNSGLEMGTVVGDGVATLTFSNAVENVEFRINDLENNFETAQIRAYDADNNPIVFTVSTGANIAASDTDAVAGDDEFEGTSGPTSDATASGSVLIGIAGPVGRIEVDYTDNGGSLTVTDIWFDDPATGIAGEAAGNDVIDGGAGDDSIDSGAGNDTIYGGSGNDNIFFNDGTDTVYGGTGNDTIDDLSGEPGFDAANLIYGGAGDDRAFVGDGDDIVFGGDGNDLGFGGGRRRHILWWRRE